MRRRFFPSRRGASSAPLPDLASRNIGYLPFGGQTVRHSPVNKNTKPNFSESFYITRDRAADHPDIVNRQAADRAQLLAGDGMPEFRAAMVAYYAAMEAMTTAACARLRRRALARPADYFANAFFAEPNCTIRLIHYPPHSDPEDNEFGFAPHTDNNFITFLAQSALPGLEVRTAEGEWIRPPAVLGTFVVQYRGDVGALFRTTASRRRRTVWSTATIASRYAIPFLRAESRRARRLRVELRRVPTTRRATSRRPTATLRHERLLTLNFAHRRRRGILSNSVARRSRDLRLQPLKISPHKIFANPDACQPHPPAACRVDSLPVDTPGRVGEGAGLLHPPRCARHLAAPPPACGARAGVRVARRHPSNSTASLLLRGCGAGRRGRVAHGAALGHRTGRTRPCLKWRGAGVRGSRRTRAARPRKIGRRRLGAVFVEGAIAATGP